jgi:HAD superfamily hydrolase (TIGR01509 family)
MKAVIFDLDGVLVSTDIIHKESLLRAVYEVAIIDASSFPVISEKSMMSTREKLKLIQNYYHFCDDTFNCIIAEKDKIFLNKIVSLKVSNNIIECLEYLHTLKIKTAVASNSRLVNINAIMSSTGIGKYFTAIVSAEEVKNRKPAPDILFEVYRRLKLKKLDYSKTLFIEDSDEGAAAGNNSPSIVLRINNPEDLTLTLLKDWIN